MLSTSACLDHSEQGAISFFFFSGLKLVKKEFDFLPWMVFQDKYYKPGQYSPQKRNDRGIPCQLLWRPVSQWGYLGYGPCSSVCGPLNLSFYLLSPKSAKECLYCIIILAEIEALILLNLRKLHLSYLQQLHRSWLTGYVVTLPLLGPLFPILMWCMFYF